jgi:hypothetical protein
MPGANFAIARFLDLVLPGAGVLLDIMEAIEQVQVGIEAGDIVQTAGQKLIEELADSRRKGTTKVSSDKVHRVIQRCGICRQQGHMLHEAKDLRGASLRPWPCSAS